LLSLKEIEMALLINDDCTACDACKPVCPNEAISVGSPIYLIDPAKCTECVGAHDEPQCIDVCPADCIVPDPSNAETPDQLKAKYERLHP
jgi:ferredoxin